MTAVVVLLAVVSALLTVMVVGLLRSHAEILRILHDHGLDANPMHDDHDKIPAAPPEVKTRAGVPEPRVGGGMRAVNIAGQTPTGSTRAVSMKGDHATLLAFLTTGCATCANFWTAFAEGVDLPPDTRLVIVTKGTDAESPAEVATLAPQDAVTIMSTRAWDAYSVPVAPYFMLVDGRRGVVAGEGAAASWDRVVALLDKAMADSGYGTGSPLDRRELFTGRPREDRADRQLIELGFEPGDPRLYHEPESPSAAQPT